MAYYEKLNNGKIRARIYIGEGKLKSKSFSNKTNAKRWAIKNEQAKINGVKIASRDELFTDVYGEWFHDIQAPAIAESSFKNYYNAGRISHRLFEGYTLSDFEDLRIIQTVLDEYGKTVAQKTIEDYLKKVRRVLCNALLQRKITHDITWALKAHGKKSSKKVNRALTMTEFNKLRSYLFENIDVKFNVLVLLATETGARRGELPALTPSDLLLDSFEVSFTKSSESG